MVTKVQKWGNSQGLRLSKDLLEEAWISVGEEVVAARDGEIVIPRPANAREAKPAGARRQDSEELQG